mmetsp:Transcript_28846/g.88245  ORF Transcript_28846/g.88245 Transcript_28846/m.88245 type:complete len:278 (+) Transcript_28846:511-1344(+)
MLWERERVQRGQLGRPIRGRDLANVADDVLLHRRREPVPRVRAVRGGPDDGALRRLDFLELHRGRGVRRRQNRLRPRSPQGGADGVLDLRELRRRRSREFCGDVGRRLQVRAVVPRDVALRRGGWRDVQRRLLGARPRRGRVPVGQALRGHHVRGRLFDVLRSPRLYARRHRRLLRRALPGRRVWLQSKRPRVPRPEPFRLLVPRGHRRRLVCRERHLLLGAGGRRLRLARQRRPRRGRRRGFGISAAPALPPVVGCRLQRRHPRRQPLRRPERLLL